LFSLLGDLQRSEYEHSAYTYFQIFDNKKRDIHKAKIRDRIIHQIVYDFLGFTILPKAVLLRDKTKNKLYNKISLKNQTSYFAILKQCHSHHLKLKIRSMEKLAENW